VNHPGYIGEDELWHRPTSTRWVSSIFRPYPMDLAILRIGTPDPAVPLYPLGLADQPAELGDQVTACGFPKGLELHNNATVNASFATGTVSAILPDPDMPPTMRRRLQLDAVILGGASGGPVCELEGGRVIGVTVQNYREIISAPGPNGSNLEVPLAIGFAEDAVFLRQVIEAEAQAFASGEPHKSLLDPG
jgi:S1-C subfamily serine protease